MPAALPTYDPRVIELAAQKLHGKATAVVQGCTAAGVVLGGAFGAIPLTSIGDAWPIPSTFGLATALVGAVLGGLVGYVVGDARGFGYRLQAQATLSQVHLERNIAITARAVADLAETMRTGRVAEQPATAVEAPEARAALGLVPPVSPPVSGQR